MAYRDGYCSDDSTLYSRGSGHRRRHSPPSDYDSRRPRRNRRRASPPGADKKSSTTGTFVKLGLGVALVQIVATCFNAWMKEKEEAKEKAHRREKRRAFEKAKAKRRREEEEHEKRRRWEEDGEEGEGEGDWDERETIIREGRRIEYVAADVDLAREVSEEREVRRIEPAPDDYHDYEQSSDEDDEWNAARRRAPSVATRNRSQFGRRKSVTGMRDARSRSRPAERVV